jgi:uncharacterized protein (UPF0332 family)
MLSDKRIKEAENNVKNYLSENLLKKTTEQNSIVLRTLRNNSKESIKVAEIVSNGNHSNLWVIVTSYYSMYYIANAVLYKYGYKVGDRISHKVTSDSLIVFIRGKLKETLLETYEQMKEEVLAGIKADEIIETFDFERTKRSLFQYHTTEEVKLSKAKTSLQRAKEFLYEMNNLLEKTKSKKEI